MCKHTQICTHTHTVELLERDREEKGQRRMHTRENTIFLSDWSMCGYLFNIRPKKKYSSRRSYIIENISWQRLLSHNLSRARGRDTWLRWLWGSSLVKKNPKGAPQNKLHGNIDLIQAPPVEAGTIFCNYFLLMIQPAVVINQYWLELKHIL